MTIIDTKEFDFAYKAMQYPLPPTWKYAIRQQDQIMWLLQALLTINEDYDNFDDAIAKLEKLVNDTVKQLNDLVNQTIADFEKVINDTKTEFNAELDKVHKELTATQGMQAILQKMQEDLKKFKEEKLDTGVYMNRWFADNMNLLAEWFDTFIEEHVTKAIEGFAQFVSFGLTDDGYFCAWVPEHWSELEFSTGTDYDNANEYGHLILNYI